MTRRNLALIVLACLLTISFYVWGTGPSFVPTGDQAAFALLAESIHEGEGYRDIARPNPPSHTKFPPGFPFLLSLARTVPRNSPLDFSPEKGLIAFLGLLGGILTYSVARRVMGASRTAAATTAFLTVLNARFFFLSHSMMSEVPFLTASLGLFLIIRVFSLHPQIFSIHLVLVIRLVGLSLSLRLASVAACGACVCYILVGRPQASARLSSTLLHRFPKALLVLGVTAILLFLWVIRNQSVSEQSFDYLPQFFSAGEKSLTISEQEADQGTNLIARTWDGLSFYAKETRNLLFLEEELLHKIQGEAWWRKAAVLAARCFFVLLFGLCLLVFLHRLIARRSLDAFYVLLTMLMVLVWPWRTFRLILPILPFLIYYTITALNVISSLLLGKVSVAVRNALVIVVVSTIFAINAAGSYVLVQEGNGRAYGGQNILSPRTGLGFYRGDYLDMAKVALEAGKSLKGETRILCGKPDVLYLWCRLPCVPFVPTTDASKVLDQIKRHKITHVLVDPLKPNPLRESIKNGAKEFREIIRYGRTALYEVQPESSE